MISPETSNGGLCSEEPTTSNQSPGGAGPIHVWLVDDNDRLRAILAELLETRGGIVCPRQFDSPNAVLSTLASRIGPDVILLDVQMGEANGIDAIPAIKSLSRDTRVLMLTTFYDGDWHRQAMASGASDFLLKSYSLEQIAESICRPEPGAGNHARRRRPAVNRRRRGAEVNPEEARPPDREPASQSRIPLLDWFRRLARN